MKSEITKEKMLDDDKEEMEKFEIHHKSYKTVTQLLRLLPKIFVFFENIKNEAKKTQ